jgi:hypothetical protein
MPDMVVCFSLHKVPQVPKCPNILVVMLKGCGGYMLLDDKTIFVKKDSIVCARTTVFHRVINPTSNEMVFETISPGKIARPTLVRAGDFSQSLQKLQSP